MLFSSPSSILVPRTWMLSQATLDHIGGEHTLGMAKQQKGGAWVPEIFMECSHHPVPEPCTPELLQERKINFYRF